MNQPYGKPKQSLLSFVLLVVLLLGASTANAGWTGLIPPEVSSGWSLSKVSLVSPAEGWAAGEDRVSREGVLLRFSAGSWDRVPSPVISNNWTLSDLQLLSPGEGWAAGADRSGGKGVLLHGVEGEWVSVLPPSVSSDWFLSGVHFTSGSEGWAVGFDGVSKKGVLLHHSGGLWAASTAPAVSSNWDLRSVHFPVPSEGWAVGKDTSQGKGVLLHFNAEAGLWEAVPAPEISTLWELNAVRFVSQDEGWAVGTDGANGRGVILHRIGGIWQTVAPPDVSQDWDLQDVRFTSEREGWAVGRDLLGGRGVLLHFSGGAWTTVPPPEVSGNWDLTGVDFVSPYFGFAVGQDQQNGMGALLQFFVPPPEITVVPNVLRFGNILLGHIVSETIVVRNDGFSDLILFSRTAPDAPFAITAADCADGTVLAPGASCTVTVQFSPTAAGAFLSSITITSNDPGQPEIVIPLSGGSGPDLVGEWISFSQFCETVREEVACELKGVLEVVNAGNLDARSSVVTFHLSDDSNLDEGDLLIGRSKIGRLKPIKGKEVKLKFKLRGETASGRFLIAVIDARDDVVEADESNNVAVFGPIP